MPLVRICAGGGQQWPSLPRLGKGKMGKKGKKGGSLESTIFSGHRTSMDHILVENYATTTAWRVAGSALPHHPAWRRPPGDVCQRYGPRDLPRSPAAKP